MKPIITAPAVLGITPAAPDAPAETDRHQLTIQVDKESRLLLSKSLSSSPGGDPISGGIHYEEFSSGISHVSASTLKLPAQIAVIKSTNKDFVKRVM